MIENLMKVAGADPAIATSPAGEAKSAASVDPASKAGAATASSSTSDAGQSPIQLSITQDERGVFVYRLVDTTTGRLVAEVPREAVETLRNSPDYTAGALLSTSA